MHRIPSRWLYILGALVMGLGPLLAVPATSAQSGQDLEGSPAQTFADAVATLGQTSYPSTFAGATLTADGTVQVYVTAKNDQQFAAAVAAADSAAIPYQLVSMGLSYGALSLITTDIASDAAILRADGVVLTSWGPDPESGRVDVGVAPPSPAQVSALTGALAAAGIAASPSSTTATYTTNVGALLGHLTGGAAVTVTVDDSPIPVAAGRYGDTSPFWGGDRVYQSDNPVASSMCTSGFGVIGNATGHMFTTTAGHCLTGQYYTTPTD